MLLSNLKQRRRSAQKGATVLNKTLAHINQTTHFFTYGTNADQKELTRESTAPGPWKSSSTLVLGKEDNSTSQTNKTTRRDSVVQSQVQHPPSSHRRARSLRPVQGKGSAVEVPNQQQTEVRTIFQTPLDANEFFEYRFSPLHKDGTNIRSHASRNTSIDAEKKSVLITCLDSKHSKETKVKPVKCRKLSSDWIIGPDQVVPSEGRKVTYHLPAARITDSDMAKTKRANNVTDRVASQTSYVWGNHRSYLHSDGTERVNSPEKPREDENLPKEGTLMKYFRGRELKPANSVDYQQVIQNQQAIYDQLMMEEDACQVKRKPHDSLSSYLQAVRSDYMRKNSQSSKRRTASCDNSTRLDVNLNENKMKLEDFYRPNKMPSLIDGFTEKVKKYFQTRNDCIDAARSIKADSIFVDSFLKGEFSTSLKLTQEVGEKQADISIQVKGNLDSTIIPFDLEGLGISNRPANTEESEASPKKKQGRLSNQKISLHVSNLFGDTTEMFEQAHVDDFAQLLQYLQQRNKTIEENIKQVDEERDRKKWNGRLIDTVIGKIKEKGGVNQALTKSECFSAMKFDKDIEKIQEIRKEVLTAGKNIDVAETSKEEMILSNREKLEKAKFISPCFLTNSELEFIRTQFTQRGPEELQIEKIDEILKRLKFFTQLSKGVRINFYQCTKYIREPKGQYIFHYGDKGDLMYIILKGSVSVKVPKKLKDGRYQFVTVASLYDGSHFGELAIMGAKPKPKKVQKEEEEDKLKRPRSSKIQEKTALENKNGTSAANALDKPQNGEEGNTQAKTEEQKLEVEDGGPAHQRRSASIQCAEETELLTMSRDRFQEILLSVMNKDMDTKIRLLQLTPFYKELNNFTLMPVATNMVHMEFKLGQKIIQTGDILMNFYIIAKGTCKVVHEIIEEYDYDDTIYRKNLKPFRYKHFCDIPEDEINKEEQEDDKDDKKKEYPPNPAERMFEYMNCYDKDGKSKGKGHKFTKHIVFKELIAGNFFGFRPLLRPEADKDYKEIKELRAKLSVVAYSPEVEVFVLPRGNLLYLPERVKTLLIDGIEKMVDFDEIDVKAKVQEQKEWRKFQVGMIEDTLARCESAVLCEAKVKPEDHGQSALLEKAFMYNGQDIRRVITESNKDELSEIFAVNVMRLMCEHKKCPYPFYKLDVPSYFNPEAPSQVVNGSFPRGRKMLYDGISHICEFNDKLQREKADQLTGYLQTVIASLVPISAKLQYIGLAFYTLSLILEENQIDKMKKYINKVSEISQNELDLKLLKKILEDLKANLLSIQNILKEIVKRGPRDEKNSKILLISLSKPCEAICQKVKAKEGILRQFPFYSILIATHFFALHLSLLSFSKEFGVIMESQIQEKAREYPELVKEYIQIAAQQRLRCFYKSHVPSKKLKDGPLESKTLDKLTGEVLQLPLTGRLIWNPELSKKYFLDKFEPNLEHLRNCISHL